MLRYMHSYILRDKRADCMYLQLALLFAFLEKLFYIKGT